VAGYKDRYRFSLRLREHIEAPEASDAAMADVNAQVSADGAAWGDASLAAAGVLQDPASLPAALAANPALLDNLDMDALGDAVAGNLDSLDTGQLNGMLDTLAAADPSKAGGLIDALGKAGALGGMLAKYAQEGADFLKQLDPSKLSSLMKAFSGGLDFLKQLKAVADSATAWRVPSDLKLPPSSTGSSRRPEMSTPSDVIRDLATLVQDLAALLETQTAGDPQHRPRPGRPAPAGHGRRRPRSGARRDSRQPCPAPHRPRRRRAGGAARLCAGVRRRMGQAVDASGEWLADLGLGDAAAAAARVSGPCARFPACSTWASTWPKAPFPCSPPASGADSSPPSTACPSRSRP
jgi:hypothetical protein